MMSRALLAVLCLGLFGCSEIPKRDPAKAGPFFTPTNVTQLGTLPTELRRVLVLPAASPSNLTEETFLQLDTAVRDEISRTGRFEIVSVSRAELRKVIGEYAYLSTASLPHDFFEKLGQRFGVDGLLFTDVTTYSPYPPIALGLRVKLARISDRQVMWAADNVFSATNPAVANSARRHALKLGRDRGPGDLSHTILQSPSRFAAYALHETFATLPNR